MKFFRLKILLWPILLVILVFVGGTGAAAAFGAVNVLAFGSLFSSSSEQRNEQVVKSIERKEEVVLLQLGVEGITDEKTNGKIGPFDIPWTDRTLFLRYSFDAKLGIDGRSVTITPTGDGAFRVTIPAFIFIGVDNEKAEVAVEQNGALAWTQPEIDDQELRNDILDDAAKATHVRDNRELLESQAEAFYSGIIHAVDPDAVLEFEFAQ